MNRFDPNYIYSQRTYGGSREALRPLMKEAMSGLQTSLGYQQAGLEGKKRMETAVGMGLPFNTDIRKAELVGMGADRMPTYRAPRPMPFGTFGSVGINTEDRPASLPRTPKMPSGGPQPAQGSSVSSQPNQGISRREGDPKGQLRNRFGYLEPEEWYTQDSESKSWRKKTEQEYRKSRNAPQNTPEMPPQNNSWRMSLIGGGMPPVFPY